MQTIITDLPEEAALFLNRGKTVAFPTETVYGLGADAFNQEAIAAIFRAKGRPSDNPLIVHTADPGQIDQVAACIGEAAGKLIDHFFPGPLTVVLKKRASLPDIVTAGLPTVGIRCPSHPVASAFLHACRHPVAAPSANLSGRPSSTDWKTVWYDLGGRIDCLLRGPRSAIGLESTIVDCSVEPPILLRSGAIAEETLRETIPNLRSAFPGHTGETPKSPGMKYRHYAPEALVVAVEEPPEEIPTEPPAAFIGLSQPPPGAKHAMQCSSVEEYAHVLFAFFRTCDSMELRVIFCELPKPEGIGRAIRDRIFKAAAP